MNPHLLGIAEATAQPLLLQTFQRRRRYDGARPSRSVLCDSRGFFGAHRDIHAIATDHVFTSRAFYESTTRDRRTSFHRARS